MASARESPSRTGGLRRECPRSAGAASAWSGSRDLLLARTPRGAAADGGGPGSQLFASRACARRSPCPVPLSDGRGHPRLDTAHVGAGVFTFRYASDPHRNAAVRAKVGHSVTFFHVGSAGQVQRRQRYLPLLERHRSQAGGLSSLPPRPRVRPRRPASPRFRVAPPTGSPERLKEATRLKRPQQHRTRKRLTAPPKGHWS